MRVCNRKTGGQSSLPKALQPGVTSRVTQPVLFPAGATQIKIHRIVVHQNDGQPETKKELNRPRQQKIDIRPSGWMPSLLMFY